MLGANPSQKILRLSCNNIIITDFVEDPAHYFERAAIGIVPLFRGAGVKLKTLEMLKSGLAVISTRIGTEGVDTEYRLFVSDNFKEWIKLIQELSCM